MITKEHSDINLVFVYGTLKQNGVYSHIMSNAGGEYIGDHKTENEYLMVDVGHYPIVLVGGGDSISGEVWHIKDIRPLDILEGYPTFYDRKIINTKFGPAWMYVQDRSVAAFPDANIVRDGVWKCP